MSRGCNTGPDARVARDLRSNPAGMHARDADVAALEFVAQRLRESTHRKLAGRVSALSRRSDHSENARNVHNLRALFPFQYWEKICDAIYSAPEIDIHQQAKIIQ